MAPSVSLTSKTSRKGKFFVLFLMKGEFKSWIVRIETVYSPSIGGRQLGLSERGHNVAGSHQANRNIHFMNLRLHCLLVFGITSLPRRSKKYEIGTSSMKTEMRVDARRE